jgi:alanine dehydrogenase
MEPTETLLLTRYEVAELLTLDECITAVERAFCLYGRGKVLPPKVLGIHTNNGGFHIKAGTLGNEHNYFVAKINGNFPNNSKQFGLPTIQGIIVICDTNNGRLLALMDSIEITIIRTGAATAVAAKYLSVPDAKIVTICGCGNQGRISIQMLMKVRKPEKIFVFDIDPAQSEKLAKEFAKEINTVAITMNDLPNALRESQICITCTPSRQPFICTEHIAPGTFIAAVGADSEEKQELFPELLASNKVVVDVSDQCSVIGELHHAIEKGLMTGSDVHAELGSVIAGKKTGRESNQEIIIFDSTGTALQDVAAAVIVYEKAVRKNASAKLNFSEKKIAGKNSASAKEIAALKLFYPFK